MSVCSYLVTAKSGEMECLTEELRSLEYCEVYPAENQDVLILLSEVPGLVQDRHLQQFLSNNEKILDISLCFGEIEHEPS